MLWLESYAVGYGFALLVGHILVKMNVDALWEDLGVLKEQRKPWHAAFLGVLERTMYVGSFGWGQPSFIPLWLGLKVIPQWKRWNEEIKAKDGKIIEGRAVFNVFLMGNALSVILAAVGAKSIEWLNHGQVAVTGAVCLLVVIGTAISWWWLRRLTAVRTTRRSNKGREVAQSP